MSLQVPVENMEKKGLASILAAYEALSSSKTGALATGSEFAWLAQARAKAAQRWSTEGLPTRKSERWKYTSLSMLHEAQVGLPENDESGASISGFDAGRFSAEIVFVNGFFSPSASRIPELAGIQFTSLAEAMNGNLSDECREILAMFRSWIEASDSQSESVFAAMNTSFMQDALIIQVENGRAINEPVLIRHVTSFSKDESVLLISCPRVFVSIGRGAEFALVEVFSSESDAKWFVNSVTDVSLHEAARVSYCRLQIENENSLHIGTTRIHHKRNSFSESGQFTFGARLSREDLLIRLDAEGAEAKLGGLYIAKGQQHIDNYTLVDHAVPYTTSQQVYKGILDGESRAVFNGHVRIHRNAQKSNAAQVNKNLVLSRKAEVDTRPELEIDADDVKASHGATVGQIDPEHIYYLQSRGISKAEAIKMLSGGFAQDVVFDIRNEAIRSFMRGIVGERLNQMEVDHA